MEVIRYSESELTAEWEYQVPEALCATMYQYLAHGREVGSFLNAVLRNDLQQAATFADGENRPLLADIAHLLWCFPPEAAGSDWKVRQWKTRGGLVGQNRLAKFREDLYNEDVDVINPVMLAADREEFRREHQSEGNWVDLPATKVDADGTISFKHVRFRGSQKLS